MWLFICILPLLSYSQTLGGACDYTTYPYQGLACLDANTLGYCENGYFKGQSCADGTFCTVKSTGEVGCVGKCVTTTLTTTQWITTTISSTKTILSTLKATTTLATTTTKTTSTTKATMTSSALQVNSQTTTKSSSPSATTTSSHYMAPTTTLTTQPTQGTNSTTGLGDRSFSVFNGMLTISPVSAISTFVMGSVGTLAGLGLHSRYFNHRH